MSVVGKNLNFTEVAWTSFLNRFGGNVLGEGGAINLSFSPKMITSLPDIFILLWSCAASDILGLCALGGHFLRWRRTFLASFFSTCINVLLVNFITMYSDVETNK